MAKTPAPSDLTPKPATWKRYVKIGLPVLVVVLALWFLFSAELTIKGYLNRLSGADPRVRREMKEALENHSDRELVNRLMLEAVKDDDRDFGVRQVCVDLLLKRQRLEDLNKALRTGSVRTRGVILRTLSSRAFFQKTYVEDESYRARETVLEWLKIEGDLTRSHAIQLAMLMDMKDAMPLIRPLLTVRHAPSVHQSVQRAVTIAAAGAVERFGDCESVSALADLAESAGNPIVRLRCMQNLDRVAFRDTPPAACLDALEAARMQAIVGGALDDTDHRVRMTAMLILARKPEWTKQVSDKIAGILDSDVTSSERRQALETLMALAEEPFLERFPRYFHDASAEVRSSAVRAASLSTSVPVTGCMIGLVERESESDVIFHNVMVAVHDRVGEWVGFPGPLRKKAVRDRTAFKRDLDTLFRRGEIEGVTRKGLAEDLFGWWCGELGLTEDQAKQALEARRAFWAAAERRDDAAAQAVLDGISFDVVGLFTDEQGWLMSRGG